MSVPLELPSCFVLLILEYLKLPSRNCSCVLLMFKTGCHVNNKLKLNENKTEVIVLGAPQTCQNDNKLPKIFLHVWIDPTDFVCNLGITFDVAVKQIVDWSPG